MAGLNSLRNMSRTDKAVCELQAAIVAGDAEAAGKAASRAAEGRFKRVSKALRQVGRL